MTLVAVSIPTSAVMPIAIISAVSTARSICACKACTAMRRASISTGVDNRAMDW